jgi:hypothetical protein
MMVSGIGTSSGFEERIRFSEIEIVDSNAIETGVMHTLPEGNYINGWDVNVAGVRVTQVKHTIRKHKHAEFILRVKKKGELEYYVGRRYSDFAKLHRRLRNELPGRVLPEMPKKNKSDTTTTALTSVFSNGNDSDASSISSVSTRVTGLALTPDGSSSMLSPGKAIIHLCDIHTDIRQGHRRAGSAASFRSSRSRGLNSPKIPSPRASTEGGRLSPGVVPSPDKEVRFILGSLDIIN